MPPSDVCFCVYKSGNHNTMDQGTLKELNKRSSQQEWKKRQKKKRLRIWTETERKVKKIKIKLNNCALRIPRALFFPITLALASAVPFVQFRYLLLLVFFRFVSLRLASLFFPLCDVTSPARVGRNSNGALTNSQTDKPTDSETNSRHRRSTQQNKRERAASAANRPADASKLAALVYGRCKCVHSEKSRGSYRRYLHMCMHLYCVRIA